MNPPDNRHLRLVRSAWNNTITMPVTVIFASLAAKECGKMGMTTWRDLFVVLVGVSIGFTLGLWGAVLVDKITSQTKP